MHSVVIGGLPTAQRAGSQVQAAGGVLLRPARQGRRHEVALVHRPDHDDWSLPKGKLERGESLEECAVREVLEETGYGCVLGTFVGSTEYKDRRGRDKVVAYWLMHPAEGVRFDEPAAGATDEVDELRWTELSVADGVLTYRRDRELVARIGTADLAHLG